MSKRMVAQEALVEALLIHGDQSKAAVACGLTRRTVQRWLSLPEFRTMYAEARRTVLVHAVGALQARTNQAVSVLVSLMTSAESEAVRLQAAGKVLEMAVKTHELLDLEDRVAALEAANQEDPQ